MLVIVFVDEAAVAVSFKFYYNVVFMIVDVCKTSDMNVRFIKVSFLVPNEVHYIPVLNEIHV